MLVILVLLALLAERWRGQWALNRWKQRMAARGEVFEASRIWPPPSPRGREFSNALFRAVSQIPSGLSRYSGQLAGIVVQQPGLSRRGSQEPNPPLAYPREGANSWDDLGFQLRQAQPALQSLRRLVIHPPGDLGYDILPRLEQFNLPNMVGVRCAVQALQAATVFDLHGGNLAGAKDNLVALAGFTKLYAGDPTLVSYMVRMAVLGLSVDVAWDALQANGWTDAQLAEVQQAFRTEDLLAQMPRTFEAARAERLFELNWFASHSYVSWVARYEPVYQMFGEKPPAADGILTHRCFREWATHPLWKFAWADQETLEYLVNAQRELDAVREAVKTGSGHELTQRLHSLHETYCRPPVAWRFYLRLPLAREMGKPPYPYPDFSRACSTAIKNVTLGQMMVTAVAIKRYELQHGQAPAKLEALAPQFAGKVPRDLIDGQSLRYYLRSDGSWCLYSLAENAQDDQGNPVPAVDEGSRDSIWNGRDWVWPRMVPVGREPRPGIVSRK